MRNAGRLKLGYFPLPIEEGRRLRRLIHCPHPFSVLDPCIGTGEALHLLTERIDCKRYGIELDAHRALTASQAGIETVQGNLFDAHGKVETFSLLYLNHRMTPRLDHSTTSAWSCSFSAHLPLAGIRRSPLRRRSREAAFSLHTVARLKLH
jgi:hypothetical protein